MNPAPKPAPKAKRPRRPLGRSEKPIRRSAIKPKNAKRKSKRFETDFGGAEYRAYIVSLPCDICGIEGYSDPAHLKSRGAGGKADVLAPLCGVRPNPMHHSVRGAIPALYVTGCHTLYDEHPWLLPEGTQERLLKLAAKRRATWLRESDTTTTEDK